MKYFFRIPQFTKNRFNFISIVLLSFFLFLFPTIGHAEKCKPLQPPLIGGFKHGIEKRCYANGSIQFQGRWDRGKKHYNWRWWHDNRKLAQEIVYHHGQKNGRWIQWDRSEKVIQKSFYRLDRPHSFQTVPFSWWGLLFYLLVGSLGVALLARNLGFVFESLSKRLYYSSDAKNFEAMKKPVVLLSIAVVHVFLIPWWPFWSLIGLSILMVLLLLWSFHFLTKSNESNLLELGMFAVAAIFSFGMIFYSFFSIQADRVYRVLVEPTLLSWSIFTLEHLIRAVDVFDFLESFHIGFYNLKAEGPILRAYVVAFHFVVDILLFYFFLACYQYYQTYIQVRSDAVPRETLTLRRSAPFIGLFVIGLGGVFYVWRPFGTISSMFLAILLVNIGILLGLWWFMVKISAQTNSKRLYIFLTLVIGGWFVWMGSAGLLFQSMIPNFSRQTMSFGGMMLVAFESLIHTLDFIDIFNTYQWKIADSPLNKHWMTGTFIFFFRVACGLLILPLLKNLIVMKGAITLKSVEELNQLASQGGDLARIAMDELRKRGEKIHLQRNLYGVHFENADLSQLFLNNCNLQHANLQHANLQRTYLEGADLQGANLADVNLTMAKLKRANLEGANLQDADLRQALFEEANLRNTTLRSANLSQTRLEGANLEGANLEGANLSFTKLKGANLKNATLHGANLNGTNLEDATLHGADLTGVRYTQYTKWPKGFDCEQSGAMYIKES